MTDRQYYADCWLSRTDDHDGEIKQLKIRKDSIIESMSGVGKYDDKAVHGGSDSTGKETVMEKTFQRQDIDFDSKGTRCSAWLYLPDSDKKCPIIVMAHGLGGTREMHLNEYAERFASAGYACFLFDYRNYGASDGNQRQLINVKMQLEDWNSAIEYIKRDTRVDGDNLLLFGSSFSGGHVIWLSAHRKDIKALQPSK